MLKKIRSIFKKEVKETPYQKMGRLGVSPEHMMMYENATKKLKEQ